MLKNIIFSTFFSLGFISLVQAASGDVIILHSGVNPNTILLRESTNANHIILGNTSYSSGFTRLYWDHEKIKATMLEARRQGQIVDIIATEKRGTLSPYKDIEMKTRPASAEEKANRVMQLQDEVLRLQGENSALKAVLNLKTN